jgi:hypothetical protein
MTAEIAIAGVYNSGAERIISRIESSMQSHIPLLFQTLNRNTDQIATQKSGYSGFVLMKAPL